MADENEQKTDSQEQKTDSQEQKTDSQQQVAAPKEQTSTESQPTAKKSILPWVVVVLAVIACAGAGFGLSRLLADSASQQQSAATEQDTAKQDTKTAANAPDTGKRWYYDLEPVVANLNEPLVTRYVRATLTLEINSALDAQEGVALIEKKKPVLASFLSIYLAGLTLENCRGDKNLKRIQSEILDAFNERLFPDATPQVKAILFKEFAIQ